MTTITNTATNTVTTVDTKAFYTSKTFWSGILSIITGIAMIAQTGQVSMAAISAIIAGIGAIIGRTYATGPIGLSTFTTTTNGTTNGTNTPPFDPLRSK